MWLVVILNVLLVLVVAITDDSRTQPATRVMRLTLDHVVVDPGEAQRELSSRLAVPVVAVIIDDIDFVRETTRVAVRYTVDDEVWLVSASSDGAVGSAEQVEA